MSWQVDGIDVRDIEMIWVAAQGCRLAVFFELVDGQTLVVDFDLGAEPGSQSFMPTIVEEAAPKNETR